MEDVMSRDNVTVDGRSNIQTFADEHLLRGRRCFVVTENGRVARLITPTKSGKSRTRDGLIA